MSRKRVTAWVLVLVAGVACRVAVAAPRAATAELRAVICCGEHCPTATRRPMTPKRCCFVDAGATDPASAPVLSLLERPAVATTVLPAPAVDLAPLAVRRVRDEVALVRAGPPPYLRTLQLRN